MLEIPRQCLMANPVHLQKGMPSGSFKTNALVLRLGTLAYNALRLLGILGKRVFRHRHPTQRHHLRTIIQELIYLPDRILDPTQSLTSSHSGAVPEGQHRLPGWMKWDCGTARGSCSLSTCPIGQS